ncbi:MAG: HupE/UreJ family protein [Candidatus Binatia bacterium]
MDEQVAGALLLRRGDDACERSGPVLRTASAGGRETLAWRVDCHATGLLEIESVLPQLLGTAHLCFVVAGHDLEVVLDRESARWQQRADTGGRPPAFLDSFRLGIEHIAGGLDHLLFVFGLVVVAASISEAAVVITAFTVAHMLTLAGAAVGLLRPPAAPVEALIAMSIGLVAVENLTLCGGARERGGAPVAAVGVMAPARHRFGHRFPRLILEPASVVLLAASVAWYVTRTFG